MAYIVGLTATDGCLITGRRKINFKSNDHQLVETYLRVIGRTNRVKAQRTRTGGVVYFTEFGDTRLYEWFLDAGLTPRKSLTLGALAVPDAFLFPALRGLFEGDGHIQNFVHKPTLATYPNYEYERLVVCFNSASRLHLEWIQERVRTVAQQVGAIQKFRKPNRHDFFRLMYGKHASIALLSAMYPTDDVPKLERKWRTWEDYRQRHGLS
jgi:hypothetical protein